MEKTSDEFYIFVNFLLSPPLPPQNECFWGYAGISLSVRPFACLSVQNSTGGVCDTKLLLLLVICVANSYTFASVVLKLCTYIDHILKFCQGSGYSVAFTDNFSSTC